MNLAATRVLCASPRGRMRFLLFVLKMMHISHSTTTIYDSAAGSMKIRYVMYSKI